MCSGCCRYIPDHFIAKIPFIGSWLVRWNNAEVGGPLFYLIRPFFRKKIQECERGFIEAVNEEAN